MASLRGHPRGAWLLVFTEFLERFSYYGMLSLLVLFLTAPGARGGMAWPQAEAIALFGTFSAAIWLTPLAGGWIADRWLGQRRAVLIGGLAMAAGHFALVGVSLAPGAGASVSGLFFAGLALIAGGNGLLKPNLTVMLGELYPKSDRRREEAFTLFYVAISAGATLAALTAGTLGERVGWRFGFGLCGAVMLAGILAYRALAPRLLGDVGLKPAPHPAAAEAAPAASGAASAIAFVVLLSLFATVFWTGYQQSGGLLTVFANERVDRDLGGFLVPASWIPAFSAAFTILFGFAVASILGWVEGRGVVLDPVRRFAIGLVFGALAFASIAFGAGQAEAAGQPMPVAWFFVFFFLLVVGELALSPAGFAMVTRYAPPRLGGRLMGLWLLSVALGSLLSGVVGAWAASHPIHWTLAAVAGAFLVTAIVLLALRRPLMALVEPRP